LSFGLTYKGKSIGVWLSAAALLACLILSWVFAQERVLNTDNSAFFFNLVNTEQVSVAEKRYSAELPQYPAYVAIKLGASLNTVLHIFSISYTLLYLVIFGLILFLCKHQEAAVALALSLLLGVFHSFYHPVTETHQAIAWTLLCYAFLGSNLKPLLKSIGIVLSFLLALFAHPAAVFMLAFVLVWEAVSKQNYKSWWHYVAFIGLVVFAVLRSKMNAGNYDATQYENLFKSLGNLQQFFHWNSVGFITDRPVLYAWPLLIWLAALLALAIGQQWLKLALLLFGPLAILIIAAATFSNGDSQMMMEKAYMPAWTMIAIGSSFLFVSEGSLGLAASLFLALFFAATLIHINMAGNKQFKPRLQAMDKVIEAFKASKQQKFWCLEPTAPAVWRSNWWATANDMLVRSTITTGKSLTLYLALPEEHLEHAKDSHAFLYTNWWRDRDIQILNKRFFSFEPQAYDTINLNDYE
jgi:hypothetical protein